MQQQQQSQAMMMPSFPQSSITTDQIQKCLDDNKKLILAIMENQNLGKLADCAHYQALLQKNLMYLAAIADAQPPGPVMTSQMAPHPMMQQGGFYVQHPQPAGVPQQQQQQQQQQQPLFTAKGPLQFNSPHTMPDFQQQQKMHQYQQQGLAGQLGTRTVGNMNPVNIEAGRSVSQSEAKAPSNVRVGNKPDANDAGVSIPDAARSSASGKGSGNNEGK